MQALGFLSPDIAPAGYAAKLQMLMAALTALTSFSVILFLLPVLSRAAVRIGLLDYPQERKVHLIPKPLIGGIGMAAAFFVCSLLFVPRASFSGLYAGIVILLIVGFFDDYREFTHRWKFLAQIFAAILMMHLSKTFLFSLGDLLSLGVIKLGIMAIPVTIFCTVGVINAINMSDGLDGLAGGIALVAFVSFGAAAFIDNRPDLLFLSLALVGALIGFLRYNWHPATLFMGDAGSLVLGFALAFFSIDLTQHEGTRISPMFPVLILAVPIVDTIAVMLKRVLENKSPFHADKNHLHHLLMRMGYSHASTVKIILLISSLLSLFALSATVMRAPDHYLFLIFALYFFVHLIGSFSADIAVKRGAAPLGETGQKHLRYYTSIVVDYKKKTLLIFHTLKGGIAMKRLTLMVLAVLAVVFLFQSPVLSATNGAANSLAASMKSELSAGKGPRDVVKDALLAGNVAPAVFEAACEIGISVEDAIFGAIAAGVSPDVIARSATGVCADAATVAEIMGRDDVVLAYGGPGRGFGPPSFVTPPGSRGGGRPFSTPPPVSPSIP